MINMGSLSQPTDETANRPTSAVAERYGFRGERRESGGFSEQPTGNTVSPQELPRKTYSNECRSMAPVQHRAVPAWETLPQPAA